MSMCSPCPRCRRELRPDQLEAGQRCVRCDVLILDKSMDVLLAGIRLPRRLRKQLAA